MYSSVRKKMASLPGTVTGTQVLRRAVPQPQNWPAGKWILNGSKDWQWTSISTCPPCLPSKAVQIFEPLINNHVCLLRAFESSTLSLDELFRARNCLRLSQNRDFLTRRLFPPSLQISTHEVAAAVLGKMLQNFDPRFSNVL